MGEKARHPPNWTSRKVFPGRFVGTPGGALQAWRPCLRAWPRSSSSSTQGRSSASPRGAKWLPSQPHGAGAAAPPPAAAAPGARGLGAGDRRWKRTRSDAPPGSWSPRSGPQGDGRPSPERAAHLRGDHAAHGPSRVSRQRRAGAHRGGRRGPRPVLPGRRLTALPAASRAGRHAAGEAAPSSLLGDRPGWGLGRLSLLFYWGCSELLKSSWMPGIG